jgi:high-affinity iron transporter
MLRLPNDGDSHQRMHSMKTIVKVLSVLLIVSVFIWQAVTGHGNPDPTTRGLNHWSQILSSGVLVFREGLEAILVLATVTAGIARTGRTDYVRAVPLGATAAFLATIATWFIVVAALKVVNVPELSLQAGTGLVAIIVLLVVMNWFFHKIYWTGWIGNLNERRQKLLAATTDVGAKTFIGLTLLGFAAIYREGFEVVLFLQNLRLTAGGAVVLQGTLIGLGLTLLVAGLTFGAQKKLPYKKMLIATGIMLGFVLLVMVGEEAQEMQQAGWISTTNINLAMPAWLGVWFSVFPTVQTLAAQALAALLVIGSYFAAQHVRLTRPRQNMQAQ